ncbi:MAG: hypothetical protein ACR2NN_03580 [Bryobacteraceae bacterium]
MNDLVQIGIDAASPHPFDNTQVLELFYQSSIGRSNYNAGLLTLTKRNAAGLTFSLNYTYSKSLDQTSLNQNGLADLVSSFFPNLDYGPSDFDRRHIFSGYGVYELPFGRGKRFLNSSGFVDRIAGGWFLSGIYVVRSGVPLTVSEGGQVFGGSDVLTTNVGAIPTQAPNFGNDIHTGVTGSNKVGVSGNPTTGGTGLNLFADPAAVLGNFRPIDLASDTRDGRGVLRGLPFWNLDVGVGKATRITERVRLQFSMDFINVFNHVVFNNPSSLSLQNPAAFGVLTTQNNNPRQLQAGLRLEF